MPAFISTSIAGIDKRHGTDQRVSICTISCTRSIVPSRSLARFLTKALRTTRDVGENMGSHSVDAGSRHLMRWQGERVPETVIVH